MRILNESYSFCSHECRLKWLISKNRETRETNENSALREYKKRIEALREHVESQRSIGEVAHDFVRGKANGLIEAYAMITDTTPRFIYSNRCESVSPKQEKKEETGAMFPEDEVEKRCNERMDELEKRVNKDLNGVYDDLLAKVKKLEKNSNNMQLEEAMSKMQICDYCGMEFENRTSFSTFFCSSSCREKWIEQYRDD
jgi:hypothetical protein